MKIDLSNLESQIEEIMLKKMNEAKAEILDCLKNHFSDINVSENKTDDLKTINNEFDDIFDTGYSELISNQNEFNGALLEHIKSEKIGLDNITIEEWLRSRKPDAPLTEALLYNVVESLMEILRAKKQVTCDDHEKMVQSGVDYLKQKMSQH